MRTPSADTILLLKRKRADADADADADATLHLTGRDVPEAAYAMRFRDGAWCLLDGRASACPLADTRAERALADAGGSVGQAEGPRSRAWHHLRPRRRRRFRRMASAGQIDANGRGDYFECPALTLSLPYPPSPGSLSFCPCRPHCPVSRPAGDRRDRRDRCSAADVRRLGRWQSATGPFVVDPARPTRLGGLSADDGKREAPSVHEHG